MKKNGYYYSYYECFPSNKYVMEKQNYLYYIELDLLEEGEYVDELRALLPRELL